jgi:tRNA (guanine37-N1)-methyltransferase
MRKRLRKTFAETNTSRDCFRMYSAFDIIGDLAIIKMPSHLEASADEAARAVMALHKNVKSVFVQTTKVQGDFRLRGLTHVGGENRTSTLYKESGCLFRVDVAKCYFSPRLSGERARIANLVEHGETVVNMFAGVGCFSIAIAKRANNVKVYSIDINPAAIEFMIENIRLNKVYARVIPILGDARTVISDRLHGCADRVLMPLPEKALKYLPAAVSALKQEGGWIHPHMFVHTIKTKNPCEIVRQKLSETFNRLDIEYEIATTRVVRSTGPNWWQIAADIHILGCE